MRRPIQLGLVLALALGLAASPAHAGADLYLDGDGLANALTPWILEHTDPAARRAHTRRSMWKRLWNGDDFLGADHAPTRALRQWLEGQPDASVTPHTLYTRAIELEGGNVENGLLLVWDALREHYQSSARNDVRYVRKLVDITGELDQFRRHGLAERNQKLTGLASSVPLVSTLAAKRSGEKKAVRGDNFSAWYHFAGTALHSFIVVNSGSLSARLHANKLHTNGLVFLEEHVLFNEFADPLKRRQIDWAGTNFGARLARNLRRYPTLDDFQRAPEAGKTQYLYDNPRVYGERWRLAPDQRPWEWRDPRSLRQRLSKLPRRAAPQGH